MKAAVKGGKEIGFAVVAMTLTLAAVYAPIAFTEGKAGKLFVEFALTLAGAVLISGFIALTLTPMMCSRLLRHEKKPGAVFSLIEKFLNSISIGYQKSLAVALRVKWLVVLIGLAVAGANVFLLGILKSEL